MKILFFFNFILFFNWCVRFTCKRETNTLIDVQPHTHTATNEKYSFHAQARETNTTIKKGRRVKINKSVKKVEKNLPLIILCQWTLLTSVTLVPSVLCQETLFTMCVRVTLLYFVRFEKCVWKVGLKIWLKSWHVNVVSRSGHGEHLFEIEMKKYYMKIKLTSRKTMKKKFEKKMKIFEKIFLG